MKSTKQIDTNITPSTSARVNAFLKTLNISERLHRGNGYWYFVNGNSSKWPSSSVPVCRITSYTINGWLAQLLILAASECDFVVEYAKNEDDLVIRHWAAPRDTYRMRSADSVEILNALRSKFGFTEL